MNVDEKELIMYKASDIKPKRYPDEKPDSTSFVYHVYDDKTFGWVRSYYYGGPVWDGKATWFIDIPGAPPELKPIAYPENKPDFKGLCWVHVKNFDVWQEALWIDGMDVIWSANDIDYFIPYRLDKEREPEIKACPACKYKQSEYREDYGGCWICLNPFCRLAGPHDDKDAHKWNALPRRNGEE